MQDTGPAYADCTRNVPFERDDCDELHDALKDRQAERFEILTRTPVVFHSAAVIAARARLQEHIRERALFKAEDSLFGVLS